MESLFSKGFVFTLDRHRTWKDVVMDQGLAETKTWRYIFACHQKECKMVLNTGSHPLNTWYGVDDVFIPTRWDNFKKKVIPKI